jgi:RNA recognition motif-containing protein
MPQKLFVGNLPHEVTDSELGEFVSGAGFQAASAVVIRDKTTGQSRGFGFNWLRARTWNGPLPA